MHKRYLGILRGLLGFTIKTGLSDSMLGALISVASMSMFFLYLPQNHIQRGSSLLNLFVLPLMIWAFLVFIDKALRKSYNFSVFIIQIFWVLSWAGWLGMIFVGISTLSEWYNNSGNGQLEPYFIATTLCAASYLAAGKKLDKFMPVDGAVNRAWDEFLKKKN